MKVKGLRWMVIGLIMLITIINYLDRGTLNYMWVANIDYHLVSEADASADKGNHAVLAGEQYLLTAANGNRDSVSVANVQMKEKNGVTFVTNREGIAIDLGLIDRNDPDASQKAKDILGLITIFFMIAYGISQLVSGKLYDKIGCRKGFFWSVLVWGAADALASLSRGIFSLTFFRMMLGLGEAGPWPGTTKSNAEGSRRRNALSHRFVRGGSIHRFNPCTDYYPDALHCFRLETDFYCSRRIRTDLVDSLVDYQ